MYCLGDSYCNILECFDAVSCEREDIGLNLNSIPLRLSCILLKLSSIRCNGASAASNKRLNSI